jgi:hypothetical protein
MPKKLLAITILTAILVLVIGVQVVEVGANPVPFTQTPNLEKPILTTVLPQNYSTYTKDDIALNLTISQPNSWNAVHWLTHYVGEINKVEVYLDGNQTAEYTAYHTYKYLNGNKTMIYPENVGDEFSLSNISDWINQASIGKHALNVTVISHTYSLTQYPGSNVKVGAVYDGQPIYEYPIIVSDAIYFTVASNDEVNPSPTVPEFPIASILLVLAVASISLVYFKRRKDKQ